MCWAHVVDEGTVFDGAVAEAGVEGDLETDVLAALAAQCSRRDWKVVRTAFSWGRRYGRTGRGRRSRI